jgi:hypothetical protein
MLVKFPYNGEEELMWQPSDRCIHKDKPLDSIWHGRTRMRRSGLCRFGTTVNNGPLLDIKIV